MCCDTVSHDSLPHDSSGSLVCATPLPGNYCSSWTDRYGSWLSWGYLSLHLTRDETEVTSIHIQACNDMWSEITSQKSKWLGELVYLTSLLNSQGLIIDGAGAGGWDVGWKGPRHEYTGFPTGDPVVWSRMFYRSTKHTALASQKNTYDMPDDAKACSVVTGTSDRAVRVG